MSDRFHPSQGAAALAMAVVIAAALLMPMSAVAQKPQSASKPPVQGWTKKTPDGQPDLQGFWSSQTNTPLERDARCGTKEFWTDEEMANGTRTCGPLTGAGRGQRGAGPGAAGGQRGRGQRSN